MGDTMDVQHGTLAFSTQLTDCETLEQSMREDCREAVQNLEAGSSDLAVGSSEIKYDVNCETTFIGGYFDVADRAGKRPQGQLRRLWSGVRRLKRPASPSCRELAQVEHSQT